MSFYSVIVYKADLEITERFRHLFEKEGFSVSIEDKKKDLLRALAKGEVQLAILDLENGENEELNNLKDIKVLNYEFMVLLLASSSSMDTVVRAL